MKKINNAANPDELAILRVKGYSIAGITDDIKRIVNDMAMTCMESPNCIGLAANQIWDDPIMPPPAIFVLRMEDGVLPYINPILEQEWKKQNEMFEMCMSVPGKKVKVTRPYHIRVRYLDGDGVEHTDHLYGMMARIWLHEYDHIQGKIITDHGRAT